MKQPERYRFRKPAHPYRCERAKSDMTPCYTDDGEVVLDVNGICVGCNLSVERIATVEGKEIALLP